MATLPLPDGTLHYEVASEGPTVLFIHGAGVCGSGWEPQVQGLSKQFRCIWFDNRGIGQSTGDVQTLTIEQMARDAKALLDEVGARTVHVVAHSMGGLIAQQLALDVPGRIVSLSLLCTFAKGSQAARITPSIAWLGMQTRVGSRAMRRAAFLKMLFSEEYIRQQGGAPLAAKLAPVIGRDLADSPSIMMKQLGAMRKHDISAKLGALKDVPTLVLSAQHDPIALPMFGRELAASIPGARYEEIADASHGVTLQMPERVNGILRGHIEAVPQRYTKGE